MESPPKINKRADSAIPSLHTYSKATKILFWKNFCILMFTAASFITVKAWNQPTISGWSDQENVLYIHSVIHHQKRKSCHLQQHGWNLRALCSGNSQTEEDEILLVSCICELTEKRNHVKNGFMYRENRLVDAKTRRVGWMHDGGLQGTNCLLQSYKVVRLYCTEWRLWWAILYCWIESCYKVNFKVCITGKIV